VESTDAFQRWLRARRSERKKSNDNGPDPAAEGLLASVNDASKTVAGLHLAFIAFYAYVAVIVWGTTHEELLRVTPVKLPILQTELSIVGFYAWVPWLLVLLHINLLMQLYLLSRKLWRLRGIFEEHRSIAPLAKTVSIFPFSQLVAIPDMGRLIRGLLSLLISVSVILIPVALLVYAQLKFLPFHDEFTTWVQRVAVTADIGSLLLLWPRLACETGRWRDWWSIGWVTMVTSLQRKRAKKQYGPVGAWTLIFTTTAGLLLSAAALVPAGALRAPNYPLSLPACLMEWPSDSQPLNRRDQSGRDNNKQVLDARTVELWSLEAVIVEALNRRWLRNIFLKNFEEPSGKNSRQSAMLYLTWVLTERGPDPWFPRNLRLTNTVAVQGLPSPKVLNAVLSDTESERRQADLELRGLDLHSQDLRYARLDSVTFANADFSGSQLDGATLNNASLRDANLCHARMQGAVLAGADLRGAKLQRAQLDGANLERTRLTGANLWAAQLQGADLASAELQGANLFSAQLQGAFLPWADLQGANLWAAQLQGANLDSTRLQAADLHEAQLQGAKLAGAQLQGANLQGARLQGADLSNAQLKGTILIKAELQGASFDASTLEFNLLSASSTGTLSADHIEKILNELKVSKPLHDAVQHLLKSRAGKPTTGFKPKRCYGLDHDAKACFRASQSAAYLQHWTKALAELVCSPDGDVAPIAQVVPTYVVHFLTSDPSPGREFVARRIADYAPEIASLNQRVGRQFAGQLLNSGCVGRSSLKTSQLKSLEALVRKTASSPVGNGDRSAGRSRSVPPPIR